MLYLPKYAQISIWIQNFSRKWSHWQWKLLLLPKFAHIKTWPLNFNQKMLTMEFGFMSFWTKLDFQYSVYCFSSLFFVQKLILRKLNFCNFQVTLIWMLITLDFGVFSCQKSRFWLKMHQNITTGIFGQKMDFWNCVFDALP